MAACIRFQGIFLILFLLSSRITSAAPVSELEGKGASNEPGSGKFVDQFERYVKEVQPEDVVSFELGAGDKKSFFGRVALLPAALRGAYTVSGGEKNKVSLIVYAPNGSVVLTRAHAKEVIFSYDADSVGEYRLEFTSKNVTFHKPKC